MQTSCAGTIHSHPVPRIIDGSKIDEPALDKTVLVGESETFAVNVNTAHVLPVGCEPADVCTILTRFGPSTSIMKKLINGNVA